MKEAVSVLLLTVLFVSSSVPAFGQNGKSARSSGQSRPKPINNETPSTKFSSAEAFTDGNGVWVRWQMDSEVGNAGFNLYRINSQGRTLVPDKFTPGALARNANGNASGAKYSAFDAAGTTDDSYEIESVTSTAQPDKSIKASTKYVSDITSVAGNSSDFFQSKSSLDAFSVISTAQALPYDLDAEVSTYQAAPDSTKQKFVASQPGVKIGVKNAGFYRVTRAELQAAGFDVNSSPSLWQLYTDGVEQAIIVGGNGDYIEFYGKSINAPESDTRVYFLIVGSGPGRRITSRLSRSGLGSIVSPAYDQTFVQSEKKFLVAELSNGDAENYWGRFVNSVGTTLTFNLSGVPTSGNIVFNASVLGFSSTSHTVNLTLNNTFIGAITGFNNLTEGTVQFTLPATSIHDGSNSLFMQTTGDNCFFDNITIDFPRKYLASQNQLSFHTENYKIANLDGFTSPGIRVFDTTVDGSPVLINNLVGLQNGPTFGVTMPAAPGRVFFAVEDSAIQTAASVTPNLPTTLSTPNHNATLIIISYPDFANLPVDPTCLVGSPNYPGCLPPAQQWAVYRQGQGTSTEVVRIDDIYDEFNYGVPSHNAIRNFLNYAKNNWTTPPQYVLLLGDSSNDPKNYLAFGNFDLIPTRSVNSPLGEIDSDEALVDFNDDGIGDLAIGRIPARQASSILDVLNKVKVFESNGQTLTSLGTLWGYDVGGPEDNHPFTSGQNDFFYDHTTALTSQLPSGVAKTYISRIAPLGTDALNNGNGKAAFVSAINPDTKGPVNQRLPGKYFVNYSGHGSISVMGTTDPRILRNDDLVNNGTPTLINTTAPSIFVSLSCLNAFFTDPQLNNISIGELLLSLGSGNLTINAGSNTGGGAVAVWGSTFETTPFAQKAMGSRFYKQVGLGTVPGKADPRLGDYIVDAKAFIAFGAEVRASWALLGDPMLKIKAQ